MTNNAGRREIFLNEMRLGPVWRQRVDANSSEHFPESVPVISHDYLSDAVPSPVLHAASAPAVAIADMNWTQLKSAVAACTACGLCQRRMQTVFGSGNTKAKWLFVGEGPGINEDAQGEPFVGPSGKLLDNMLLAMGLTRNGSDATVYIANIVKCRPADAAGRDRPPTAEEIASCLPYLQRQIALIQPTIIVALGKTAALSLLGLDLETALAGLLGKVHRHGGLPLIVTYHPAYLLRKPQEKAQAWRDLRLAMATYARLDSSAA